MQNIRKTIKSIDMKKIKKYVVFKYEDVSGFHYMVMDKLPGEEPTHPETLTFKEKINSNCTPGAITRQQFSGGGKSAYVPSSKFVTVVGWWPDNEDILEWREKAQAYKATKAPERKGGDPKLEKVIEPIREADNPLNPSRMWRRLIALMVGFFDK